MSETRVTFALHKVVAVLDGYADGILRHEFDMTYSQFMFLLSLDGAPRSQGEVAAQLDVSPAAVSKRVSWFVERGLVATSHDPANARRVLLSLTAKGRRQVARASDALEAAFVGKFADLKGVDLSLMGTMLNTVLKHLGDHPEEASA